MKTIRKTYWLWLAASLCAPVFTVSAAGVAVESESATNCGAIVEYSRHTVILAADGGRTSRVEMRTRVFDDSAAAFWSKLTIDFDAMRDTVIFETARVHLPDGAWIEAGPATFRITNRSGTGHVPVVSLAQEASVEIPDVRAGATIHFVYSIQSKGTFGKRLPEGGLEYFAGDFPILERQFDLIADSSRFAQYRCVNGLAEPEIVTSNGRTTYTWRQSDIMPEDAEPGAASPEWWRPQVQWTTMRDWDDLALYVTRQFWAKVDASDQAVAGYARYTPPLLQGRPALMQATLRVQQHVRTVSQSSAAVNYMPRSADAIWQIGYGDVLEKAVLLTALLRAYGFAPLPALVPGRSQPIAELPVLQQFEHVIVMVPMGSDTLWLDPAAENYAPDELPVEQTFGQACLLTAGMPMLMKVPAGPAERRGAATELRAQLEANGNLTGSFLCLPRGDAAARARALLQSRSESELDDYAARCAAAGGRGGLAADFRASNLEDVTKQVSIGLDIVAPAFAAVKSGRLVFDVPSVPFGFARPAFFPMADSAKYPAALPGPARFTYECVITLPPGARVAQLPMPMIIDNPYFFAEIAVRVTESAIHWSLTTEIKTDILPVQDYAAIAAAYRSLSESKTKRFELILQ